MRAEEKSSTPTPLSKYTYPHKNDIPGFLISLGIIKTSAEAVSLDMYKKIKVNDKYPTSSFQTLVEGDVVHVIIPIIKDGKYEFTERTEVYHEEVSDA